jgi:hypothetical protein
MNGISLVQVREFFDWYFSQIPFVSPTPEEIAAHSFGFNYDEFIGGLKDKLGDVVYGLSTKTHTGGEGELIDQYGSVTEPMSLDIILLKKVARGNSDESDTIFSLQEEAMDACKHELMNLRSWLQQVNHTDQKCDYPIVGYIEMENITHKRMGPVAEEYYGWKIRLNLRTYLSEEVEFDPETAPPVWYAEKGSIAVYDGEKWTVLAPGTSGHVLTSNGADELPSYQEASGGIEEEEDPVFAAWLSGVAQVANWNTAFGWGNHAGLYSLLGHTHSIAEVTGLQGALDGLQDDVATAVDLITNHSLEAARLVDNFFEGEVDMNGNSLRNLPAPTNADEAVNKAYVDGLIDNTLKQPQVFTPAGTYPVTYNGNAIQAGDSFRIAAAGAIGARTVNTEDLLIAIADAPGQTDANWQVLESNRDQASESVKGVAQIATQAEVEDELTSENTHIVTPQKGWFMLLRFIQLSWTWAAKQIFTLAPRFSSVTAQQPLVTDANKDLISITYAAFKTSLSLSKADVGLSNVDNVQQFPAASVTMNVDFSVAAAVTGFSSLTSNVAVYSRVGSLVFVQIAFQGQSDATTITFNLPFQAASACQWLGAAVTNNGVTSNTPGMISFPAGSTTGACYRDRTLTNWTASGIKTFIVQFFYSA